MQHLRRKHKIPVILARKEAVKLKKPFEGKTPQPIAFRYLHQPLPALGESPLPALPGLPLYDIIGCEVCSLYCKGTSALRSHMRSTHLSAKGIYDLLQNLSERPLLKGQTLFNGPQKLYFPVSVDSLSPRDTPSSCAPSESILFGDFEQNEPNSDIISIRERSANLCTKVLRIPEFIDAHNLTLEEAHKISSVGDQSIFSRLSKLLVIYVQYFSELNPPIPLSIVEAVKIRDPNTVASFSLGIKMASKERYARVITRFIITVSNVGPPLKTRFHLSDALVSSATDVMSLPHPSEGIGFDTLRCIHGFCRNLLLQSVTASEGELLPLEALFKIVIAGYTCSITNKRVRVGDSEDASHMAASLQYFCHVAALGEFYVAPIGFGEPRVRGDNARISYVRNLVSTECYTPASFLRTVLFKTKHISAGETPSVNFVPCQIHPYCGSVHNIEIQMNSSSPGSLGYAVRNIASDVEKIIRHDLMMDYTVPQGFCDTILSFCDKYNERTPGYFFGSEADASTRLRSWAEDFAKYLSEQPNPIFERRVSNGAQQWRPSEHAAQWFRAVDKLTPLLYVLVHICGGGPPRVTEMIDSKLRNAAGSRRNLFIIKKSLAIIGVYSKTSLQFAKPKPIARFLDRRTTELLLLFVVYIKPMQGFLLRKTATQTDAVEDYLFCQSGEKFDEKNICREFSKVLSSKGIPLNVSMYRHYRTGIAKAFIATNTSHSYDELAFWQAGHTEVTAQMRYAGGSFSFEDLSIAKLEGFHSVSRRWHELLGLKDTHPLVRTAERTSKSTKPRQNMRTGNEFAATPSTAAELLVDPGERSHEVAAERENIDVDITVAERQNNSGSVVPGEVSRKGAESPSSISIAIKRKRALPNPSASTNPTVSPQFLNSTVMDSVRKVLGLENGRKISFKSNAQRAAVFESTMHTILTGYSSSMLVVLPTGGGKTLCWAAPALREQRLWDSCSMRPPITTVVVPLIALQQDILRRCIRYGIRCAEWEDRFKYGVTVVVCSADVVFTSQYNSFVTSLFAQGRLARIVVDEAHLLLQWKRLRKFSLIGPRMRPGETKEVPLLLMSATVTNNMVLELQELVGAEMSCFKTYRALNTRPNIKYEVLLVESMRGEEMLSTCAKIIHDELLGMNPRDRVIAYCLTVRECRQLYDALMSMKSGYEVCLYYGSMSHEERSVNFESWMKKDSHVPIVMSSTSAFSCGIDYDHVRSVIHVGGARSIVELAQESGRLGRDGILAKNIVVYNEWYLDNRIGGKNEDGANQSANSFGDIKRFLDTSGNCRRMILESFLNNSTRGPCVGVEIRCDLCEESSCSATTTTEPMCTQPVPDRNNVSDINGNAMRNRMLVSAPAPAPARNKSANEGIPCLVFGFDKANAIWKAKQLSRSSCAVCLFAKRSMRDTTSHSRCMRGVCYRCAEAGATHQSSTCNVTPRSTKHVKRCFFCGLPESVDLHEPGTFNQRGKCPWNVAKDLALLSWRSPVYRTSLCAEVPSIRNCRSVLEVGHALCGGDTTEQKVLLARAVEFLYKTFVLRTE